MGTAVVMNITQAQAFCCTYENIVSRYNTNNNNINSVNSHQMPSETLRMNARGLNSSDMTHIHEHVHRYFGLDNRIIFE